MSRQDGGRIISLDTIRGVSILGIFLVNMMSFHSPLLYIDPLQWWNEPLDQATYMFIDIFAQASFYPLFSLLFGFSLVIFRENALRRGMNFSVLAVRRLLMLLFIGILHAFFVWHGDILIEYALLGLVVLPMLAFSGRSLLIFGGALYGLPTLLLTLLLIFASLGGQGIPSELNNHQAIQQSLEIYQAGTFYEITSQRVIDWYFTNKLENLPFFIISIYPFMLIGAGVAKQKWLVRLGQYKRGISAVCYSLLAVGLIIKLLPYWLKGNIAAQYAQDSIGGFFLTIFYGLFIVIMVENEKWQKLLTPFAAIGKMSLSNYLFQSIIATLIFYSYGLGLYGEISLFTGTLLVLVIFALQLLLSTLWLRKFSYGPVEWLWRLVTYSKRVMLFKSEREK
ncbi:DUF418 domain-containing protein [Bacillus marasmi]|uniref:DUF418 domain-containing protein n=1 Tax=Bacillus marasmi TaxID=1926279 RepID=UPI001FE6CF3C|nr:DUF418 domain-containing protein [Bacillus marasmi]